jgi:hypothetical protein
MELGEKWPVNLACDSDFHINRRDLLHAANLQNGTGGFTSPTKEGMLWIFLPETAVILLIIITQNISLTYYNSFHHDEQSRKSEIKQ